MSSSYFYLAKNVDMELLDKNGNKIIKAKMWYPFYLSKSE